MTAILPDGSVMRDPLREAELTPELEKHAFRIRDKPALNEIMICALVNEIEKARQQIKTCGFAIDALKAQTMNAYAEHAIATAIYPGRGTTLGVAYCALKLSGEAGEVAEAIGKSIRDDAGTITPERREHLKRELGDVLWYVSALASELGFSLQVIADTNLAKLADRAMRGVLGGSGSNR